MTEKFKAANDNGAEANDNNKFGKDLNIGGGVNLSKPANSNTVVQEGSIIQLEQDFNLYAIDNSYDEVLENSPLLQEDLTKENISKEEFQNLLRKKVWTKLGEGDSEDGEQTWVLKVSQNSNLLTPQERVNFANLRIRIPVSKISATPILVNVK